MKYPDYSLWLQPNGETLEAYRRVISDLAQKYDGPLFEPHVTVLGRIMEEEQTAIERSKLVADRSSPVTVGLLQAGYGVTYHQCIYLAAEKNEALLALHEIAKNQLKADGLENPSYLPHLSLLYGEHSQEARRQIAASLPDLSGVFTASELVLMDTKGNEHEWRKIAAFPLVSESLKSAK